VLASGSIYRLALLKRLMLPFTVSPASVPEDALAGESAHELVARLSGVKAAHVAEKIPQAVVIGSDQLAVFEGDIIGKPGTVAAAIAQLQRFSGRQVEFLTGVSVQCVHSGYRGDRIVPTTVHFRKLQDREIERYVALEQPLDCAGGFKAESLGITLFERLVSDDPTALIGLPLVATAELLRAAGFDLP
jgi:septum formation protein